MLLFLHAVASTRDTVGWKGGEREGERESVTFDFYCFKQSPKPTDALHKPFYPSNTCTHANSLFPFSDSSTKFG